MFVFVREMKKCVSFFYLMNGFGYSYNVIMLNRVVEILCKEKFVEEVKYVVVKLRDCIKFDEVIYRMMIEGFCDVGDLVEVVKVWNLMMEEGFEVDVEVGKKMLEMFLKKN